VDRDRDVQEYGADAETVRDHPGGPEIVGSGNRWAPPGSRGTIAG
jgi:hypothetical protein